MLLSENVVNHQADDYDEIEAQKNFNKKLKNHLNEENINSLISLHLFSNRSDRSDLQIKFVQKCLRNHNLELNLKYPKALSQKTNFAKKKTKSIIISLGIYLEKLSLLATIINIE
ncbi:hypothetical protein BpHYR1_053894 [Brachionus plicatilis]|uniref:Uncharacterized protein n=1 Tax=Brachionus plicatilis TaxID=10195 RepID=A0A3M7T1Z3_BRAPC|nr:hypothetical protein BpHYR1_053894 [Brachionus plicatilis]